MMKWKTRIMKILNYSSLFFMGALYSSMATASMFSVGGTPDPDKDGRSVPSRNVEINDTNLYLPDPIADSVEKAKTAYAGLSHALCNTLDVTNEMEIFKVWELRNFDVNKCGFYGYGMDPVFMLKQLSSDVWKKFAQEDAHGKYLDYDALYAFWQNPVNRSFCFSEGIIHQSLKEAMKNGHLGNLTAQEPWPSTPLSSFCPPTVSEKTLVLGCYHNSPCPNHQGGIKKGSHYTVDQMGDANVNTPFENTTLWNSLKNHGFEEVILEGAGTLSDKKLMESIFSVLKPGGTFKTLHFHPSNFEDPFLYPGWVKAVGAPLVDITVKDFLEAMGFVNIDFYTPSHDEELCPDFKGIKQLKAEKPTH